MKSHSLADAKLLIGGAKGFKDAWRLGVLHVEYERLKKKNATRITGLAFLEEPVGYKIKLIERDL